MFCTLQFHRKNALKHIKKLPRNGVIVAFLARARRHFFMNNQHVLTIYQIPTVTTITPDIMLRTVL